MSASDIGSAIADVTSGKTRVLDRPRQPDEIVSAEDVTDTQKLARLLTRMLAELAILRRRFVSRRIDFQDFAFQASAEHSFAHGFGGRVNWYVIDAITDVPSLVRLPAKTDKNTLVLLSFVDCVGTLRIEAVG